MGSPGKLIVTEYIESVRSEVQEYFGELNELKAGARSVPPIKPECLIQHEMIKRLRTLMFDGAFYDQPYLWVLEDQAVAEVIEQNKLLDEINSRLTVSPAT